MNLPNLVIAGAPKCGTSSLFTWLADHPDVCGSTVKETFYLMDEAHPLRRKESNYQDHGLAGYQAYFRNCAPQHRIVFEATTHYLYQQTALEVLSRLTPQPQIVFLLRKPSERVYSSFQYSKNNLANVNHKVSFAEFVSEVKRSTESSLLDQYGGNSAYVLKRDIGYSRYIEYLEPWIARFGSDRIHTLLFEDMKRDARVFMQNLAELLRIDPGFYDKYDFPVKNETFTVKNPVLHRGARKLNRAIPRGRLKSLMQGVYLKAQSRGNGNGRSSEDQQSLLELEHDFEPFNRRLTNELGLNLSAWE
jgi:Sulfotransferase domain